MFTAGKGIVPTQELGPINMRICHQYTPIQSRAAMRTRASRPDSSTTQNSSGTSSTSSKKQEFSAADYLSPFSAVDPAMKQSQKTGTETASSSSTATPSTSQQSAGQEDSDPWSEVLATKHTLSSLYLQKFQVEPVQQRDWEAKRQKTDLQDVVKAGARLGIPGSLIQDNLAQLQALVPGLVINLDRMKASDWAKLLKNVDQVVAVVIALKSHYPKVDMGGVIMRKPRLLLASQQHINEDAAQVKAILGSRVQDIDSIIEAVPDLMNPQQLKQSIANLASWFPSQDPFALLQQNPLILEAPNVDADPTYGEITTAG